MNAQISKITIGISQKTGQTNYFVCWKCEDGHSRTSWIDAGYRNFERWKNYLTVGNTLGKLNADKKNDKYIDADSFPVLISKA